MFRAATLFLALTGGLVAGEIPLLQGHDFTGWEYVTLDPTATLGSVCHYQPDGVLAVAGRPIGFLATTAPFKNYRFHAEWRWPGQPGNGGVLVHISSGPKDRVWPLCLQIQLKHGNAGDLLPMAGAIFAEPLSTPSGAKIPLLNHSAPDSEKPAGEWNECDILCQDGTVEVTINGVRQNRITGSRPQSGQVGFQLEGTAFELRHVWIEPLGKD